MSGRCATAEVVEPSAGHRNALIQDLAARGSQAGQERSAGVFCSRGRRVQGGRHGGVRGGAPDRWYAAGRGPVPAWESTRERHELARLTEGAPQAFIGLSAPAPCSSLPTRCPRGLLVLDEMEKAHQR